MNISGQAAPLFFTSEPEATHPVSETDSNMEVDEAQGKAVLDTAFFKECQTLVHRHLLKGYDGSNTPQDQIPRMHHGAQHQSRESLWAIILLQMRREAGDLDAVNFPDSAIPALIKTCLLHDSGRKGEGVDQPEWERASGENCRQHLLASGVDPLLADQCGKAIEFKDQPGAYPYRDTPTGRLIRSLLHDADVLEVMRVRHEFDLDYLECYQTADDTARTQLFDLAKDVRDVIFHQGDLRDSASICGTLRGVRQVMAPATSSSLDVQKKMPYERAPNALMAQINDLRSTKPALFEKLQACLGLLPELETFSLSALTKQSNHRGGQGQTCEAGQYINPVNQAQYYIKSSPDPANSENEVLMAQLARIFGLNVPDYQLHRENGKAYVVSPFQKNLQRIPDFSALPKEERAQLFVVAALLGNADVVYHHSNALRAPTGELIFLDWGIAGRYSLFITNGKHTLKGNFGNNPIELSAFKNHSPELTQHYFAGWRDEAIPNHEKVFKDLTDQDLMPFVEKLLQVPAETIDQLIELYGPEKPGERQRLRQTLHNRRAWFALRFPQACNSPLSPAECGAIKASGVTGFCRSVKFMDTVGGEVRFWERQKEDGTLQTLATLTLTEDAAQRLESQQGVVSQRRLLVDRLNFYRMRIRNATPDPEFKEELLKMAETCRSMARNITDNGEQWFHSSADNIRRFNEAADMLANAAESNQPINLDGLPVIENVPALLPGRVSFTAVATDESTPCNIQSGFGKCLPAAGQAHEQGLEKYHSYNFIVGQGVSCRYHAGDLPKAKTFERQLSLEADGGIEQAGSSIVDALNHLGICTERPSFNDMQEAYLDSLARYSDCFHTMNSQLTTESSLCQQDRVKFKGQYLVQKLSLNEVPLWDEHCNLAAGKKVYFYPKYPFTGKPLHNNEYQPCHRLNYKSNRSPTRVIAAILNNGNTLDSVNERRRKGIPVDGSEALQSNIETGAGNTVFTRIRKKTGDSGSVRLQFKTDLLTRLDTQLFPDNQHVTDTTLAFTDPVAARLRRKRLLDQATCDQLAKKHAARPQDDNQLTVPDSISLDEDLDFISVSTKEDQKRVIALLAKRFGHWADGRDINALVVVYKYSEDNYHRLGQHPDIGCLVKAAGYDQFRKLLDQNPDIKHGKVTSLNGIQLSGNIEKINFSNINLEGSVFNSCNFTSCNFEGVDFTKVGIKDSKFLNCQFGNNVKLNRENVKEMTFSFYPYPTLDILYLQGKIRFFDKGDEAKGMEEDEAEKLELIYKAGLLEHECYFTSGISKYYLKKVNTKNIPLLDKKLLQVCVEHHWLYPKLKEKCSDRIGLLTPYSLAFILCSCENEETKLKERVVDSICNEINHHNLYNHDKKFISLPHIKQLIQFAHYLGYEDELHRQLATCSLFHEAMREED